MDSRKDTTRRLMRPSGEGGAGFPEFCPQPTEEFLNFENCQKGSKRHADQQVSEVWKGTTRKIRIGDRRCNNLQACSIEAA